MSGVPEYPSSIATRRAERADRAWWARLLAADKRRRKREESASNGFAPVPYSGKGKGPAQASAGNAGPSRYPASSSRRQGKGVRKRLPASRAIKMVETELDSEEAEPACEFCPIVNRTGGTLPSPILGPFTKGQMRKTVFLHHACAMWAPEVYHDPETDKLVNVISAYQRSRGLKCSVCGDNGASVGCYVPECERVYHFCCLFGSPPSRDAHSQNDGPCVRHDDYYAAFCPKHTARANEDAYVQRMKADAAVNTLLSDRAAAVNVALAGDPERGTDCPNYHITGVRRNETETIFCRAWGVTSEAAESAWVTVTARPHRRVLQRGERLQPRQWPRRVPPSALAVALRKTLAEDAQPTGAAPIAVSRDDDGERSRRAPVFLIRNMRRYQGPPLRQSLPAVPPSFLSTHVVEGSPSRPFSPPKETDSGGKPPRGRCAGAAGGDAASAAGDGAAGGGAGAGHHAVPESSSSGPANAFGGPEITCAARPRDGPSPRQAEHEG